MRKPSHTLRDARRQIIPLKKVAAKDGWFVRRRIIRNKDRRPGQAKGRPLSRDDRPSVRFFEGLVRLPDHNRAIPKSIVSRELSPRFSSLFRYYPLQKSPRCHSRFSLPILLKAVGYSLLLEDCSSVEVIVVHRSPETTGVKTFYVVEIMYLLWKCRPAPTRTSRPRLYRAGLMIPMHSLSRDLHRCSERPWSITASLVPEEGILRILHQTRRRSRH
jgi:hypothetical protein